jgi:hypothetical protein
MLIDLLDYKDGNIKTRVDTWHQGRTKEIKTTSWFLSSVWWVVVPCTLCLFSVTVHVCHAHTCLFQHSRLTSTNSLSILDSNIIPKNLMRAQLWQESKIVVDRWNYFFPSNWSSLFNYVSFLSSFLTCIAEFVDDYVSTHLKPSLSCEGILKFPLEGTSSRFSFHSFPINVHMLNGTSSFFVSDFQPQCLLTLQWRWISWPISRISKLELSWNSVSRFSNT